VAVSLIKSRKRVADHGEVFTPAWLVDAMLDLVKDESERIDSRFLEPACGSGNFIVKVLRRKLATIEYKFGKSDFEKQHYALYPHRILSTPFIGEPGSICSETYLCIGPLDSKSEAESVLSYLTCRLTRLLILLHKPSQDTTRKVYTFVPTQDWTKQWTDADLYAKYGLTVSEIAFIEKIVRPMYLASDLLEDVTVVEEDA
jgi:hypothetical protein